MLRSLAQDFANGTTVPANARAAPEQGWRHQCTFGAFGPGSRRPPEHSPTNNSRTAALTESPFADRRPTLPARAWRREWQGKTLPRRKPAITRTASERPRNHPGADPPDT